MKIVFATNNKHKLEEVNDLLPKEIEVLTLNEIKCYEDIEETEETLEGNAKIKSDHVKMHYGFDCFADDTGLEVEALNGEPGVYSARYAGEEATFDDNVQKLLAAMKGVQNRKARFRTVISLYLDGKQLFFEGICDGFMTRFLDLRALIKLLQKWTSMQKDVFHIEEKLLRNWLLTLKVNSKTR